MKCPIDSKFNFERTDKDNLEKYSSLKSKIQLAKPDFRVELFTCMIGSLGSIPQSSLNIFKLLGLSDFKIRSLARKCSISNIEYSSKIWNFLLNSLTTYLSGAFNKYLV